MSSLSPARRAAFDVLMRVESGSYASDVLRAVTETMDSRDAGLAAQIVFGVLRRQAQLDAALSSVLPKPKLDPEVRIALRMGIFQLLHLERVPAHAVVSDAVELVKRARKRSATGLVNAVLRKTPKAPTVTTADAVPPWLLNRWTAAFGQATAQTIAQASLHEPESYVYSPTPPPVPAEPTELPNCYRLLTSDAGGLRIQDIGSQWVATLLQFVPASTFLDLCAAPGGKTRFALDAGIQTIAADRHLHRLREMIPLGCPLLVLDATHPLPFRVKFDRILVDAPCSGTGTLARNPEIKWRLRPADLTDLHHKQVCILKNALNCLSPEAYSSIPPAPSNARKTKK